MSEKEAEVQGTKHKGEGSRSRHPGLSVVCITQGLLPAQVIKTRLETADIPVLLDYESLGPIMGITVDGLGEVRVLVPEARADEARALIKEEEEEEEEEEEVSDDGCVAGAGDAQPQPPTASHSGSDQG